MTFAAPHIFRAYDIRGIAHTPTCDKAPELTPESMEQIGKATGTYLQRTSGPRLALGWDMRLSTPELKAAFLKGLLSTGAQVTELGLVTTPLLYFSVCHFGFDGGAMITASHNPKEYNGVKIVSRQAHSVCGDDLQDVLKLINAQDFLSGQGRQDSLDPFPAYLEKLSTLVRLARPLKIVVDSGNGATGSFVERLFKHLGCDVTCLFTEPNGLFPNHEANPEEAANMQDLAQKVRDLHADLGVAFDGDGDRVGIVDETGHHYQADLLLLQLSRDLLKKTPGAKIVFDAKASQVLINDIKNHGGIPVMTKTGHSFIEQALKTEGAPLGGEISGHLFFGGDYYGFDDAFLGAAKLLALASQTQKPFSSLFEDVPQTASTPELKSPCPDEIKFAIVDALREDLMQHYPCLTLDGVRVNFDPESWGAVRCSNTSPNLTLRFEAPTPERLKAIMHEMLPYLQKHPAIDLWWAKDL